MDFNHQLLDRGLARLYDSSFSKRSEYTDAEAQTQREDVGLWDFDGSAATDTPTETESSLDDSGGSRVAISRYRRAGVPIRTTARTSTPMTRHSRFSKRCRVIRASSTVTETGKRASRSHCLSNSPQICLQMIRAMGSGQYRAVASRGHDPGPTSGR